MKWLVVLALWGCVALVGCDAPSGGAEDVGLGDGPVRGVDGQDGSAGDGGADAASLRADAAPDAAADQGMPPDAFVPIEVADCVAACDRYDGCGRLVELHGDRTACLSTCERLVTGEQTGNWWSCLEVESCNLLHLCSIPEPEALSCAEICASASNCDVEIAGCEAACSDSAPAFQACGEILVAECESGAFLDCLGAEVFGGCAEACDVTVGCNLVRPDGCLLDCVAAQRDPDPLFSLHANQRTTCLSRVQGDCFAADACLNPVDPEDLGDADVGVVCAAWDACPLARELPPCRDLLEQFGGEQSTVNCVSGLLARGCPADAEQVLQACFAGQGGGQSPNGCGVLCEAEQVCGLFEGDPLGRQACLSDCAGGPRIDPDLTARSRASLSCGAADRCPDLIECLAARGPGRVCEDHCAILEGCGLAPADCEAACDAAWPRDRATAYRVCVADAAASPAACAGVAACQTPTGPPCDAYCDRAQVCGIEDELGCEGRCDDAHFAEPEAELLRQACVISAPVCRGAVFNEPQAATCEGEPAQGLGCLGYCRARTECRGDEGGLGACLQRCGAGFVGEDGLRFEGGRACLEALPVGAGCEALSACAPDVVDAGCAAYCDRAEACGVLPNCRSACDDDPLSRLRSVQSQPCLERAGDDCAAVRQCLVPVFEPADPDVLLPVAQAAFCEAWERCNLNDAFGLTCEMTLEQFGRDPSVVRCIYDGIRDVCPAEPESIFECQRPNPVSNPIAEACADLCEADAFCGDGGAVNQAACRQACEGQLDANDPDSVARLAPQLACGQAWSCAALSSCVSDSGSPADVCATHCGRLDECAAIEDVPACVAECDEGFARLRQFDWRRQVAEAVDCDAVRAVALGPALPCEAACEVLAGCGAGDARCAAQCDDRHFADPLGEAVQVACILAADGCEDVEGTPGALGCAEAPGPDARVCAGYCRAVTECDPESELALVACLNGCVSGFGDARALELAAADACLRGVALDAECGALTACLPEEVSVDCPAYCGELDRCQLPADGCPEACAGGAVDLDVAGCVADAMRTSGGCGAAATCVGFEGPAPSPICVQACALRGTCEPELDPYLCQLACTPAPAALGVQVGCAEAAACGEALDVCFELPADLDPACVAACEGTALCGDIEACAARCSGQLASGRLPDGRAGSIGACLAGAIEGGRCEPAVAEQCFAVATPLGRNRGFGHHGSCDSFNGCRDAQTCANAACRFFGFGVATAWESGLCQDLDRAIRGGMVCSLFQALPDQLDENWGRGCNIPVVYDVMCLP